MSDLCQNCGSCHLPQPCRKPLVHCETCTNFGHTFNFCPLGVSGTSYWMLCHNCDAWHLPQPCSQPLHGCVQCGAGGHIELYCPVKPQPRPDKILSSTNHTSNKRQRTSDSNADGPEPQVLTAGKRLLCVFSYDPTLTIFTEGMRQIRLMVAKDVIHLLATKNANEVLEIMAQPVEQASELPQVITAVGSAFHAARLADTPLEPRVNSGNTHHANNYVSPFGNQYVPISKQVRANPQEPPPPASDARPETSFGLQSGANEGVYTTMHDRFGRGEFARANTFANVTLPPRSDVKAMEGASDSSQQEPLMLRPSAPSQPATGKSTPEPAPKNKGVCNECKKRKRRCTHVGPNDSAVNNVPSRRELLPSPAGNAAQRAWLTNTTNQIQAPIGRQGGDLTSGHQGQQTMDVAFARNQYSPFIGIGNAANAIVCQGSPLGAAEAQSSGAMPAEQGYSVQRQVQQVQPAPVQQAEQQHAEQAPSAPGHLQGDRDGYVRVQHQDKHDHMKQMHGDRMKAAPETQAETTMGPSDTARATVSEDASEGKAVPKKRGRPKRSGYS